MIETCLRGCSFTQTVRIQNNRERSRYSSSTAMTGQTIPEKRTYPQADLLHLCGSMTIEAALVVPLFLFAALCLLSLMDMLRVYMNTELGLYNTARELAVVSYTGTGKSDSDDWVRLKLLYPVSAKMTLPCFSKTLLLENHVNVHIFNGYSGDTPEGIKERDEIVYITKDSEVYHRKRNCSHLHVSIREVAGGGISGARSLDGAKYYLCPYCGKGFAKEALSQMTLYVSDYGNKSHTRRNCPHLKRTVYAVALSQAGGRRPCRDCG